jgi:hypothetical protein
MSHYYVNRGAVLSGRGTIHGADGESVACNYRLQRQEKMERMFPLGSQDLPPRWLDGQSELELGLADGRRVPVVVKESQPGGSVVYGLTERGEDALATAPEG